MSAAAVALEARAEGQQESLTERLSRGPISLEEAVRHAVRIATCLRDLHSQGLIYGAVSSQLIQIGQWGAFLRTAGGLAQLGDGRIDVAAFGTVLDEMLRRLEGPEKWRAELDELATECRRQTPDMQQVLIALRLMGLRMRQRAVLVRTPVPQAVALPAVQQTVQRWAQAARQWKPLASFAALAVWTK